MKLRGCKHFVPRSPLPAVPCLAHRVGVDLRGLHTHFNVKGGFHFMHGGDSAIILVASFQHNQSPSCITQGDSAPKAFASLIKQQRRHRKFIGKGATAEAGDIGYRIIEGGVTEGKRFEGQGTASGRNGDERAKRGIVRKFPF